MSDFHYVRTTGPEGGVDAAEGPAIGLDLASVLVEGMPPYSIVVELITALAELLAITEEDAVVHGDLQLADITVDDTGAVSLEGFGRRRDTAPGPLGATDRFGLGRVAYHLLTGAPLPAMPSNPEDHENAVIDAVLAIDLRELPEEVVGDIQWYVARLLAWDANERPTAADTWRAFSAMQGALIGPGFVGWCAAALEGRGQRRDRADPEASWDMNPVVAVTDGPMAEGGIDFGDKPGAPGRSTGAWTKEGMKKAIQRAMVSDYLADPNTDWMPGTPVPVADRNDEPRAPDDFRASPRRALAPDRHSLQKGTPPLDPLPEPRSGPEDDRKTEVGSLGVPTSRPAPPRPKRSFIPDPPTVPAPVSEALQNTAGPPRAPPPRPSRGPAKDPDTAPQLVQRPTASEPEPPSKASLVAPPVGPPAAEAPPPEPAAPAAIAPLPDQVQIRHQPDPFADMQEDNSGDYVVWGAVAVFFVVATVFCLGVGGLGGGVALFNLTGGQGSGFDPVPNQPVAQAPKTPELAPVAGDAAAPEPEKPAPRSQPRSNRTSPRPRPEPRNASAPTPRPQPRFTPSPVSAPRVQPAPAPSFATPPRTPSLPSPAPRPTFTPPPRQAPAPRFTAPAPRPVAVAPRPTMPAPQPMSVAPRPGAIAPRPGAQGFGQPKSSPPPLPLDKDGTIVDTLLPTDATLPNGQTNEVRMTMIAHLNAATAARDAVIQGDAQGARDAVRLLGLINSPASTPPNWAPYLADMKMEAWLMENSPDIPAAAFKVAQLGQSCAQCHAGVRAGPTVRADAVPPREFVADDVMKQHAWAADWLWVGLLANDQVAWDRGARELDTAPFPSVSLTDFPEQKFMDLEDKLHQLAKEAQQARTPDARGLSFGRILSTCSRCHDVYRELEQRNAEISFP